MTPSKPSELETPTRARRAIAWGSSWALLVSTALSGCQLLGDDKPEPTKPIDAVGEEGANPAVVPAPLPDNALGNPATKTRNKSASATATATPLRMLTPEPFAPQQPVASRSGDKSALGESLLELEAEFRWPGHTPTIKVPGLDKDAREALQRRLGRAVRIELHSDGTMDMRLLGGVFPVAQGSHLQGRLDRFGQLLIWPDLSTYRVLPQGSLPALLREGRVDVVPLVFGDVEPTPAKPIARRFGFQAFETVLKANRGSLVVEMVESNEFEHAGIPLCRALLELLSIAPHPEVCSDDRVIVRATYQLPGSELQFEVHSLKNKSDSSPRALTLPPKGARFVARGLPTPRVLLGEGELETLRNTDDLGALELTNASDLGGWLLLDGNPVAFVAPRTRRTFGKLPHGDYHLELRDFFGAQLLPPGPIKVEQLTRVGEPQEVDAGAAAPDQSPNSER